MSKYNLYIMAAGKSSRFGYKPKILKTLDLNYDIFKKYFNIHIITTIENHNIISEAFKSLDVTIFSSNNYGKGSGIDVYNVIDKYSSSFICWSDAFFTEQMIKDIIRAKRSIKTKNKNLMLITKMDNPYVSIEFNKSNKMIDYTKGEKEGFQDCSIFYINELKESREEFMDMAKINDFYVIETKDKTKFFNTEEELKQIID